VKKIKKNIQEKISLKYLVDFLIFRQVKEKADPIKLFSSLTKKFSVFRC